jgi:hypothetical protein
MNEIFDLCVQLLYAFADIFGMTYKEINVWIFCIIWPIITAIMAIWIVILIQEKRKLSLQSFRL